MQKNNDTPTIEEQVDSEEESSSKLNELTKIDFATKKRNRKEYTITMIKQGISVGKSFIRIGGSEN